MRKSQAETNRWIEQQEARLGIVPPRIYPDMSGARRFHDACTVPTVTVLPSMAVVTSLAHAAADLKIAADPVYTAQVARLDAELAGILASGSNLSHAKSTRRARVPHVMTND